jgi:hypothetical protein
MSFPNATESVFQNPLEETLQRISEAWQHKQYDAIGRHPDSLKRLRMESGGVVTDEFVAEVYYNPGFGFRPDDRSRVRIPRFDLLCCQIDLAKDITLLEGESPFGAEGSWHMNDQESPVVGPGLLDLCLQN